MPYSTARDADTEQADRDLDVVSTVVPQQSSALAQQAAQQRAARQAAREALWRKSLDELFRGEIVTETMQAHAGDAFVQRAGCGKLASSLTSIRKYLSETGLSGPAAQLKVSSGNRGR